ncbi:MAG: DNRLRE domain-containing protein, partial [Bacilli bacterium]|nr:DNRLRE domain-containing protein [Bacilli bacterium]
MIKHIQKVVLSLIPFCIFLLLVPVSALNYDNIIDKKFSLAVNSEEQQNREILEEIVSKREENKKYFKMSDGSEMVNTYAVPIHFKQNNKYVEVDNELIFKDGFYINKKASYTIKYNKESSEHSLLELEKDGYTLSMTLSDSKKVNAILPKSKPKIDSSTTLEKEEIVTNISSSLEYEEIKNNIDISYTTLPDKVKESITLKDKKADKNFEYIIKTNKQLEATIAEHNILEFKDGKNVIFYLETPYMYDSEFNLSTDIKLKLEKIDAGYKLTIVPDEKWLNNKNRKYPVVIDPTITTSQIRSQIDDLFIYSGDDNVDPYAKANQHILRVGSNRFSSTKGNPTRSLIRFNIPKLNTGDQIIDAKLALYSYACSLEPGISCPDGQKIEINAHKVTKDWTDDNAKWSYLNNSYDSQVIDYQIFNFDSNDEVKLYQFDITSIVKDWYVSGKNNGLMLKEANEVKNLQREDAYFFSSDINDKYASARPVASITYRNQTGLEDYQTFSTHSIGNIEVNVNNYNGNLVLTHEDINTPGNRLPVTVNHIYNTNDKDINIGYGNGFRLNLNQTLTIDGNYIKYTDEDGTRHWFAKENSKYIDEDGLNLSLTADGNNYIMEDKEGNTSTYTKKDNTWYLTEIKDTNNNKITITLDPDNYNHITSVADGSGDMLTFTYSNNMLTKITDNSNREINYNYTNNNLQAFTYFNNDSQSIEYNNNLVTKIKDINSSYNVYEYYPNSPFRLKKITEFGVNNTQGNNLDFAYGENITSIKNTKDKKTNYLFNNYGLTTSITDLGDQNSVENAYGQEYSYDINNTKSKNRLLSEGKLIKASSNTASNQIILFDDMENDTINWDNITQGNGNINFNTTEKYKGEKSLEITSTKDENTSVYITSPFVDENETTYTISAYIKGEINAKNEKSGFFFEVNHTNIGDATSEEDVSSEKIVIPNDKWQKYSFTFKSMNAFYKTNISLGLKNVKGTIYIDNIEIKKGAVEEFGPENLIDNAGFDEKLKGIYSESNIKNGDGIYSDNGNNVLKINGDAFTYKTFSKFITLNGKNGDILNFSFWALNKGVINSGSKQNRVLFELIDSKGNYVQQENIQISPDNHEWQFINKYFTAKSDYAKIKLSFASNYQKGYILFDNIGLYKDENPLIYTYDNNGNIVTSTTNTKQKNSFIYDKKNQIVSSTNSKGRTTLYEHDINHKNRLIRTLSADGIEDINTYDNNGNITSNKTLEKKRVTLDKIDPNKSYYLKAMNSDLYLSADNINQDNERIKLSKKNDNAKFIFKKITDQDYQIFPENTTNYKAVDIAVGKKDNGTAIQLYAYNYTDAQKFKLVSNTDGTYTLKTKLTDYQKCVDIQSGNIALNTNLQLYTCNNSIAQKFILEESTDIDFNTIDSVKKIEPNKLYYIKSAVNNLYVTPSSSDTTNGTKILLKPLSTDSEWKLNHVNGNIFQIQTNIPPGRLINIAGTNKNDGAIFHLWTKNGEQSNNETFEFFNNQDGTFTIKTKLTNYTKCIDIHNADFEKNQQVQQYTCNGSLAQKFIILEKDNSGRKYIETKSEYSENGDYKIKDINELEKETTYTYNNTGTLSKMTDAKNNQINYEYDNMDRVTKITNNNTINTFTYNHDKLISIGHNGFNYNFEYDEFGNTKSTKVGNQSLITNTYEAKNGNLLKSVYGNGNEINYTYDRFDRLSSKTSNNQTTNFTYDTRGNLAYIEDENSKTYYEYDLSDRLTNYNHNNKYKIQYTYNKYDEISNINYNLNNIDKTINYKYDIDGKIKQINNIKYSYDKLNRVTRK